jgi:hypothetical protein
MACVLGIATTLLEHHRSTQCDYVAEYVGADFPIDPTENVSGIPLRHLMYGCEYVKRNGQTVRRAPTKHLMGMTMYLNDSFYASPTVQILVAKDKPELWQVCRVKAGDQATIWNTRARTGSCFPRI